MKSTLATFRRYVSAAVLLEKMPKENNFRLRWRLFRPRLLGFASKNRAGSIHGGEFVRCRGGARIHNLKYRDSRITSLRWGWYHKTIERMPALKKRERL